MLTANKTYEKINKGDGIQQMEPRELNTTDLKNISDTIDKISVTTNVNQRHANTNINMQQGQEQNTQKIIKVQYE